MEKLDSISNIRLETVLLLYDLPTNYTNIGTSPPLLFGVLILLFSVANSRPSGVVTPAVETKRVYPNKLTWKLDDEILEAIEDGYDTFKQAILANETSTLVFKKFGGQFIKDSNISPDAFAQLAIQLAYYKLLGRCDATYESASTKQFLHGRTETVRSVSNESVAFCKAAVQPVMTVEDRQLKVRNSSL